MNILKMCGAVLVGFVLGAYFYHPITAKAASGSGTIYVRNVSNGGAYTDAILANREIIGFSCTAGGPMGSECFVAAR